MLPARYEHPMALLVQSWPAARDAHPHVLQDRRAGGSRIRWAMGTAANSFAGPIAPDHPFRNVSAKIVNGLFLLSALAAEIAHFFQQRSVAPQLSRFLG